MKLQALVLSAVAVFSLTGCLGNPSQSEKSNKKLNAETAAAETQSVNPTHLACAQETCGEANRLPYTTARTTQADSELFRQHIASSLNQYLDLEISSISLKNKVLRNFSEMNIKEVSDDYLVFVNFLYFNNYGELISKSLTLESGRIKVDYTNLRQDLNKAGITSAEQVNWIILIAKTMYESDIFYSNYYLSQFPLEIFVQKVYPNLDILTAIANEAKKLQIIQDKLTKAYPILQSNAVATTAILQKAISKTPLSPDEKADFISDRMTLLSIQEFLPHGNWRDSLLQRPVNIKAIAAELLSRAQKARELNLSEEKLASERVSLAIKCSYHMLDKVASSPTPDQNQKFSHLVQGLKTDARRVIGGSQYNSAEVLQAIDKVTLVLPPTKQQTAAALSRTIKNKVQALAFMNERISKLDTNNQEDRELVLLMLAGAYSGPESKDETAFENVNEFCLENSAEEISDAAYTAYQVVNVGWRSVLYPQFGYGVVAHELGHVISAADTASMRSQFSQVKSCLNKNQDSTSYLEEDLADLFATEMMKLKPTHQANYSCLLLQQDSGEYSDLKMSSDKDGVHSSSFYRLIAIDSQLNKLTPACQSAKNSSLEGKRLQSCWGL